MALLLALPLIQGGFFVPKLAALLGERGAPRVRLERVTYC
jgi:hypothetical protein